MSKIVIFGNSGSGKTTLAKNLATKNKLAHLDLDSIAWKETIPPERLALFESNKLLDGFLSNNSNWVVEGCYSDLLALIIPKSDEIIFLNLPVSSCVSNAKNRPWEPHKYDSKEAQDANLDMLIDWIAQYEDRTDTFSKQAHEKLFADYQGEKKVFVSNTQFNLYLY